MLSAVLLHVQSYPMMQQAFQIEAQDSLNTKNCGHNRGLHAYPACLAAHCVCVERRTALTDQAILLRGLLAPHFRASHCLWEAHQCLACRECWLSAAERPSRQDCLPMLLPEGRRYQDDSIAAHEQKGHHSLICLQRKHGSTQ